jgi:hypothetical protein
MWIKLSLCTLSHPESHVLWVVSIIYPSTLQSLHLKFIPDTQSNFIVDGVNNTDTPTTHLLQGVPTYRTIFKSWAECSWLEFHQKYSKTRFIEICPCPCVRFTKSTTLLLFFKGSFFNLLEDRTLKELGLFWDMNTYYTMESESPAGISFKTLTNTEKSSIFKTKSFSRFFK